MTKKDIVHKIAAVHGTLTEAEVKHVVEMLIEKIKDAVRAGEQVTIKNFGVFKLKKQKERVARNPKTGQRVIIEERNVLVFRASKKLKFP